MNDRLALLNSQIEEQQKVLEELNHKVYLKENELGIQKLKELMSKLEIAEKRNVELSESIVEKEKIISKLKLENTKLSSVTLTKKFEIFEKEGNVANLEIKGIIIPPKNVEENNLPKENDISKENDLSKNSSLSKENTILKEKIQKMKNSIIELSTKLEKELYAKEKKNLKINENNSKLFEDLQKKNRELIVLLKKENLQNMVLRKEKYDLETICIKQEDTIKFLNKKLNISTNKKLKQHIFSHNKSNILHINDGFPRFLNIGNYHSNEHDVTHNNSTVLPYVK